jgi:hypothetical protein
MQLFWPFGRFRHYRLVKDALSSGETAGVREAILGSPYMAANNLNARFQGTYGFSVVFRRDGLPKVADQFPGFAPFIEKALRPDCNAFFLNPLLVADGAAVQPHVDLSLQTYVPGVRTPRYVAVLYVEVPAGLVGGDLRLYEGPKNVATVTPRERALLTFRGDLRHEVTAVTAGAPDIYQARLSLVVEQYRLTDHQLEHVPQFLLGTRREAAAAEAPLAGGPGAGVFGDEVRRWLDTPDAG